MEQQQQQQQLTTHWINTRRMEICYMRKFLNIVTPEQQEKFRNTDFEKLYS
jgi:hypothetical protein